MDWFLNIPWTDNEICIGVVPSKMKPFISKMNEYSSQWISSFCALFLGRNITSYLIDLDSVLLHLADSDRKQRNLEKLNCSRITLNELTKKNPQKENELPHNKFVSKCQREEC